MFGILSKPAKPVITTAEKGTNTDYHHKFDDNFSFSSVKTCGTEMEYEEYDEERVKELLSSLNKSNTKYLDTIDSLRDAIDKSKFEIALVVIFFLATK
jgi:hypothetical protein